MDTRARDFLAKYDAVRVDGIPDEEQAEHVRRTWAERDERRRADALAAAFRDISELTLLLTQDVVPLTDEQRADLRAKLDVAWADVKGQ